MVSLNISCTYFYRVCSLPHTQTNTNLSYYSYLIKTVKVYASWCKTCAVFDTRYRKLASQIGDTYKSSNSNEQVSNGNVRFAEMQFDDPNNEEMCRLLNATKLPYMLLYKGSQKLLTFNVVRPSFNY